MLENVLIKNNRIKGLLIVALISVLFSFLSSCGIYSFTGASIPPDAETISVTYFSNKAPLVEPTLSQTFTNALRDMFTNQTNLRMVSKNGDLQISGEITGYEITPEAIQADQTAALNKLTIRVNVRYVNTIDHSKDFETQFSQFKEYSSSENFNNVKSELLKDISNDLADNIFNKALVNW